MTPYWIRTDAVRLAIIPRPRGHDWLPDDISILQRAGVDVIVSALTPSEAEELGLAGEAECCRNSGMRFLSFPVEDRSVPASESDFKGLVELIDEFLRKGNAVAVHCRAGIGRSSIITASVLIHRGLPVERAFRAIEEARGCPAPDTHEQRTWVEHLSSRLKPCRE
jgi:protein-tyrosine phosphatase